MRISRSRVLRVLLAAPLFAAIPLSAQTAVAALAKTAACVTASPVAHRLGTERYAENTLNAAVDTAANIGVRFLETDVRFTADDVPVIMHDATVDRTTDGTGAVADLTLAQWRDLRTADDQPVPTLRDFINTQSALKAYAFIELKTAPTDWQMAMFVAAVKSREGKGGPKPVISAFNTGDTAGVLDRVATDLPGYNRALIQSTGDADPADITPHASILLKHHDSITSARYAKWTAGGLRVYAWADPAADPASEWLRLSYVSGYITSSPGAFLAAC